MTISVSLQPVGKNIMVNRGTTLLETTRKAGVALTAICGGDSACGSCVVKLPQNSLVSPPTLLEKDILGQHKLSSGFRLACQTVILGDLVVHIPPESLSSNQRSQVDGKGKPVVFDPLLQIYNLTIPKKLYPDKNHESCNLRDVLAKETGIAPEKLPLHKLELLPRLLKENQGQLRVVIRDQCLVTVCEPNRPVLGMAVDIGTTKLAAYLLCLETGTHLAQSGIANPQIAFGDDVMARINYALSSDERSKELQELLVDTLNSLAKDLCVQATEANSNKIRHEYHPNQLLEMVMVGNTAMHHLLLRLPVHQLGLAPYVPAISDAVDTTATELGLKTSSEANIHLLPNIAGFVGADHVAMLLASEILQENKITLYIDIGTNTEITLKTPDKMITCSTASGPAFEGAHIKNGMRASEGAIERLKIENGKIHYQVINDVKPVGICGSGILDAIAQMIQSGLVNTMGGLVNNHPMVSEGDDGLEVIIAPATITGHQDKISLSRKDISEVQLAKGAIKAAIVMLLRQTNTFSENVEKVVFAGAFGTYLNLDSAQQISLIPHLKNAKFTQVGNAAGMGAKQALLSRKKRKEALEIKDKMEYLELAGHPEFTNEFADAMLFSA